MKKRLFISLCLIITIILWLNHTQKTPRPDQPVVFQTTQNNTSIKKMALGAMPMYFEPNLGQSDPTVKYLARGPGYTLFLTPTEAVLSLLTDSSVSTNTSVVRMSLVNGRPATSIEGLDVGSGKSHYLEGNNPSIWQRDVPHYRRVRYSSVYDGIDLEYYGNPYRLEYDFIVAPGADSDVITIRFDGIEEARLNEEGHLILKVLGGEVVQQAPVVYQVIDGARHSVEGRYVKKGERAFGFEIGSYDSMVELVIDPKIIYATYLGGSGNDDAYGLGLDSEGNIYLGGKTKSTDFPLANPFQERTDEIFIVKINPADSNLVYATYLGGSEPDFIEGFDVDAAGNTYVVGWTESPDFPVVNAVQPGLSDVNPNNNNLQDPDVFIAKLNPEGNGLVYATYLGGVGSDNAFDVAVDRTGNAYIAGQTWSYDFPLVAAFQGNVNIPQQGPAESDVFVSKFSPTGSLIYSTYLGGSSSEAGQRIAVDTLGNAYVEGWASIFSADFPLRNDLIPTPQTVVNQTFVTKFNPAGQAVYSSFFLVGRGRGFAVDQAGNVYVGGYARDTDSLPLVNPIQSEYGGGAWDGYLVKLNPNGTAFEYATYLGGRENDEIMDVEVDTDGSVYLFGETYSDDFPIVDAFQPETGGGGQDRFIAKVNVDGELEYASYFGGESSELGSRKTLALDGNGGLLISFRTWSELPTTETAFQSDPRSPGSIYMAWLGESEHDFMVDLDLDQCINPVGKRLRIQNTHAGCEFPLQGIVVYSPFFQESNRFHYQDLSVTGTGLGTVTEIRFDPPDGLTATNIRSTDTEVSYDLDVDYGTVINGPVERDLIYKTEDGQETNVSQLENKPFFVVIVERAFNQSVSFNDLPMSQRRLIAGKNSVIQISVPPDPGLIGKSFTGFLVEEGQAGRAEEPSGQTDVLVVKDGYNQEERRQGADLLTMPIRRPLPAAAQRRMQCLLVVDQDKVLLCPEMQVSPVESNTLHILAVRMRVKKPDGDVMKPATEEQIQQAIHLLRKYFPVTSENVTYELGTTNLPASVDHTGNGLSENGHYELMNLMKNEIRKRNKGRQTKYNVIVTFLPEDFLYQRGNGVSDKSNCTSMIDSNPNTMFTSLSHEIGHMVQNCLQNTSTFVFKPGNRLGDEYEGGTFQCDVNPPVREIKDFVREACTDSPFVIDIHGTGEGIFSEIGAYDPIKLETRFHIPFVRDSYSIMSRGTEPSSRWISSLTYEKLIDWFIPEPGANKVSQQDPILTLTGTVSNDGTAAFSTFERSTGGIPAPASEGPYRLELLDANGTLLSEYAFDVDFVVEADPPYAADQASFGIRMLEPVGVRQVVLSKDGVEMARRTLSDNPPAIQIQSPTSGQTFSGIVNLQWTATDPDGDPLTYSIFYSPDGGESAYAVDVDLLETTYAFDTSVYDPSGQAVITVVASDGLNEVEDQVTGSLGSGGTFAATLRWDPPSSPLGPPENVSVQFGPSEAGAKREGSNRIMALNPRGSHSMSVLQSAGPAKTQVGEIEPNNRPETAQELVGPAPVTVEGQLELDDAGTLIVDFGGGIEDDIEDLFRITTTAPGLTLRLDDFNSDSDLYLIDENVTAFLGQSASVSTQGPEVIEMPSLEAGTYLIGVSLYDPTPAGPETTAYVLTVEASFESGGAGAVQGYRVYRSTQPDSRNTGTQIAEVDAGTTTYADAGLTSRAYYYQVTALYAGGESAPSQEVETAGSSQAPTVAQTPTDQSLLLGGGNLNLNLDDYFTDPNGDPLSYSASSTAPTVVGVLVSGPMLTIVPLGTGRADITITAEDSDGNRASTEFTVTIPSGVNTEDETIPIVFGLMPNYPNPFQLRTRIKYAVADAGHVKIEVYNVLGRHVKTLVDGYQSAGRYTTSWDGRDATGRPVPAGVYLYRMRSAGFERSRSMQWIR